ncbi:GHMP kinase [Flagellimonas lutaonensis]|jgi:mevalonate kinase|uniref:GHMP kinase n=2 Tax=Flagellimonas lutaonensis TaxID=516051 RepID=A0A0D5YRX5_9FLAO|nr:GHMP kinase [Allomuricauda lutaonensis]|tara:strand:- start:31757 stop:32659 length:903 start_codon:yes stop_codon:yes gene_type:complete
MIELYSHGKLLLTGEYAVLDGAKALAAPTKFGQYLRYKRASGPKVEWKSLDHRGHVWFEAIFDLGNFKIVSSSKADMAKVLQTILIEAKKLNMDFLVDGGFEVETELTFPNDWGLGSSSTLINNIATWAKVDAHQLLQNTFGGSGYDIACAKAESAIVYQLVEGNPTTKEVGLDFPFSDMLFFVHLNQKQNSREAIASYRTQKIDKHTLCKEVSRITEAILGVDSLQDFEGLLAEHEALLSKVLKMPPVKTRLFPDYFGEIKSLGAWGGDFVLATGNEKTPEYFVSKGFETVITYKGMVR